MSVVQTSSSATADLAALQEKYRGIKSDAEATPEQPVVATPIDTLETPQSRKTTILGHVRNMVDALDNTISEHPKMAVATAALAGGLIATRKSPAAVVHDIGSRIVKSVAAGAVSLLGVHAALAHLPEVVPQVTHALAISNGQAEAGLITSVVAGSIALTHALTKGGAPKSDSEPKVGFAARMREHALAISGTVLGGLAVATVAAVAGVTAPIALVAAGAVGAFAGTVMGPVAEHGKLNKAWLYATSFSLLPIGIALGLHIAGPENAGPGGTIGTILGGIATAIATCVTAENT